MKYYIAFHNDRSTFKNAFNFRNLCKYANFLWKILDEFLSKTVRERKKNTFKIYLKALKKPFFFIC